MAADLSTAIFFEELVKRLKNQLFLQMGPFIDKLYIFLMITYPVKLTLSVHFCNFRTRKCKTIIYPASCVCNHTCKIVGKEKNAYIG